MDRQMIADHLELAERHVSQGALHLEKQRQIIATLIEGGHDVRQAKDLLSVLEETQALHVADRDRLRKLNRQPKS
jgi:hypothetical protein